MANSLRLPPGCGLDLDKKLLYNIFQVKFHEARRMRKCLVCNSLVTQTPGSLSCPVCRFTHENNTSYPRSFSSLHLRAGRRSGKSLAGAHAVREELGVPNRKWWITGPTFKMLHDATMPTLLRLIPPAWVKAWNVDNLELTLVNNSVAQFRSLDDPERARGQGLDGVWMDEAAFTSERAWHVLGPSLAENAGVVISTTSPGGYDWTYDEFFKRALIDHEPGFWAAKYRTLDNPLFQQSAVLQREVAAARRRLPPEVFAAEYEGEDVNYTGSVYGHDLVAGQILEDDDAVRRLIPEWPSIDSTRPIVVGLDSGADHPFGALMVVVTPTGLVAVGEYLERMGAAVTHLSAIRQRFGLNRFAPNNIKWAANKNEAQLRLEFGLRGVGVIQAENKHEVGIQRVQSWLHMHQLYFVKSRCPITIEQMFAYRYDDNYMKDGQKREKEQVFKKKDELPDALRYAVMAWPELPALDVADQMTDRERKRWNALDDRSKLDIERIREYNNIEKQKFLDVKDKNYPIGDFWGVSDAKESVTSIF